MDLKKRAAFLTLGCKVNQYETAAMMELLEQAGYEIVSFQAEADFYIVNTCSVTNMAERKSRQMLHRAKKKHPDSIIVAVGCYVQSASEELKKEYAVDLLVGNNKKKDIVSILEKYRAAVLNSAKTKGACAEPGEKQTELIDINHTAEYENLRVHRAMEHTRAYVKIQDGCNQFCSYCLIPHTRGRVRSRQSKEILDEVQNLAKNGYREIVLTGIHISSYGQDLDGEDLLSLILLLHETEGIERIRLGSLEPRIITEDFVRVISKLPKVCPHFHLSLQSGCDATLKRMNRRYSTAQYEHSCQILRKYYDKPALTTDVIVGFPGESEEEFLQTVDFLEKIKLYEMHVFQYSQRRGTRAAKMPDQVAPGTKHERSAILLEMTRRQKREYESAFLEKEEEILAEEEIIIDGQRYITGCTKRYVKIAVLAGENRKNMIIRVKIKKYSDENRLIGESLD